MFPRRTAQHAVDKAHTHVWRSSVVHAVEEDVAKREAANHDREELRRTTTTTAPSDAWDRCNGGHSGRAYAHLVELNVLLDGDVVGNGGGGAHARVVQRPQQSLQDRQQQQRAVQVEQRAAQLRPRRPQRYRLHAHHARLIGLPTTPSRACTPPEPEHQQASGGSQHAHQTAPACTARKQLASPSPCPSKGPAGVCRR